MTDLIQVEGGEREWRLQLLKKIQKVREAVPNVEKDQTNSYSNYQYTSAAAVLNAVSRAEIEAGVVLVPYVELTEQIKDGKNFYCTVDVTVRVMDSDTGYVLPQKVSAVGKGMDVGDKAPYKAMTGGMKYIRALLYGFSFGDDPEVARPDEKPRARKSKSSSEEVDAVTADKARKLCATVMRDEDACKILGAYGTRCTQGQLDEARDKYKALEAAAKSQADPSDSDG